MAGLMLVYRKQEQKRHRLDVVDSGIAQNLRFVALSVLWKGRDTIFIGFKREFFMKKRFVLAHQIEVLLFFYPYEKILPRIPHTNPWER